MVDIEKRRADRLRVMKAIFEASEGSEATYISGATLLETLARVSENRGESRLSSLVSYGSGGGFGVLPNSAPGGVAGEAEDGGEL
ncbi:MAG TPA: hypothetical protein VKD26_02285, partial [Streptosporangiaceae bacterium]|nr:hypothetical protein [Streptosporangiaceae bacterium]